MILQRIFPKGDTVYIIKNNQIIYVLSLTKDKTVTVETNGEFNKVEIKHHKVRMADASCHQNLCVKQGWIGQGAVVCLPNKVIVTIGDKGEAADKTPYDAITR